MEVKRPTCAACGQRVPACPASPSAFIGCAHVSSGRPCEDRMHGPSFTRDVIEEAASPRSVHHWQWQNFWALLAEVDTWTP